MRISSAPGTTHATTAQKPEKDMGLTSLGASTIAKILNRAYPMLLLDGVTHLQRPTVCHAFKNLTFNEWFFPVHFPERPVFPGSLQIEAFTQAVALILTAETGNESPPAGIPLLLAAVDKARFLHPVSPGERFDIIARIERMAFGVASASTTGLVANKVVSECKITYKIVAEN